MQPDERPSRPEELGKEMGKTSITKTATRRITPNQTYELLANELIDHFPERESRRQNNIKRKVSHEKVEPEWWSEEGKRIRKIRSQERDRKREQRSRWWKD